MKNAKEYITDNIFELLKLCILPGWLIVSSWKSMRYDRWIAMYITQLSWKVKLNRYWNFYLHADTLSKLIFITTVSPLGLEMEDFNHLWCLQTVVWAWTKHDVYLTAVDSESVILTWLSPADQYSNSAAWEKQSFLGRSRELNLHFSPPLQNLTVHPWAGWMKHAVKCDSPLRLSPLQSGQQTEAVTHAQSEDWECWRRSILLPRPRWASQGWRSEVHQCPAQAPWIRESWLH